MGDWFQMKEKVDVKSIPRWQGSHTALDIAEMRQSRASVRRSEILIQLQWFVQILSVD